MSYQSYVDEITALLPLDDLYALSVEKSETSPDFVDGIVNEDDFNDFLALLPTDDMFAIFLDHLANDGEFQNVFFLNFGGAPIFCMVPATECFTFWIDIHAQDAYIFEFSLFYKSDASPDDFHGEFLREDFRALDDSTALLINTVVLKFTKNDGGESGTFYNQQKRTKDGQIFYNEELQL